MKKFLTTAILLTMFATCTTIVAQAQQEEYLGLPGDNLNLYAVMKLFQGSETLEGFERDLNDQNSRINNLDLNGDNFIDYIRVVDYVDRNVHNIVLQVAINKRETQDVAVFTVQRFSNGQVQIQLIGDEDLYGRNYIIEPIFDQQYAGATPNPGYNGNVTVVGTTSYEIAAWPVVRFMYRPDYVIWQSAWTWDYWPSYWHPWQPFSWHFYYGYHYNWYDNYYSHYHRCNDIRYDHWNEFYYHDRHCHSQYVSHRIEDGHYKNTYSHPDQRRDGEALYARTNPDHNNRRTGQNSGNSFSNYRRTNPASSGSETHNISRNNSGSERRSNSTMSTRPSTYQSTTHNAGNERRSTTTADTRPSSYQSATHNTGNERRSTTTSGTRPSSYQSTTQNSGPERKSAARSNTRSSNQQVTAYNSFSERKSANTSVNRSSANPKSYSSASTSRSSGRPASGGESFSSRRSTGQTQSVKSSKGNESRKRTESAKTTHRR